MQLCVQMFEDDEGEANEAVKANNTSDISKLLANEVEGLKKKQKTNFVFHDTQANGVIFIACQKDYGRKF